MYDQIGYMRNGHVLCPETLVVVLLLRLRIGLGLYFRWLSGQHMDGVLISRVNVRLRRGHYDLDFVAFPGGLDDAQISGYLVVTLRAPGDVTADCGAPRRSGEHISEPHGTVSELMNRTHWTFANWEERY